MLRAFLRSFAADLVGMALVAGAIVGIAAFIHWMPDEPALAGAGIVAIFVVLTIVSLRGVRRSSR